MNVKELRELLSEVPEGFTQEEFDEMEVNYSVDGFNFETPCECESGVIEFQGTCNECGELVDSDGHADTIRLFALMPHGISEQFQELIEPQLNLN